MTDKHILKITTPKYGELNLEFSGVTAEELKVMSTPETVIDMLITKNLILQKKLDNAMWFIDDCIADVENERERAALLYGHCKVTAKRIKKEIEDIKEV